jgi:hypothetical protein
LTGVWYPLGASTGTPVYSEYTIAESWANAEQTVFYALRDWLGCTEEVDCFRGYLPQNEAGVRKFANVWMMTSGGAAGAFDIERTYGTNGAWCNLLINAELTGFFESRLTALHFAGAVVAFLKSPDNMNTTGLINWCFLRDLPTAPTEVIENGKRFWEVKIPLEILFLTEGVYT